MNGLAKTGRWIAGTLLLCALLLAQPASGWSAVVTVEKRGGETIAIPPYAADDTLLIVGDVALEPDDWDALHYTAEPYHLILNMETTSISANAMSLNSTLRSVRGPAVTHIEEAAFAACESLLDIAFPVASHIGQYAFQNCAGLSSAYLPEAVELGTQAFNGCSGLTRIDLPRLEKAGESAFARCTGLTDVSLPALTELGEYAFNSATALRNVSMPAVRSLGDYAFSYCSGLESVSLPAAETVGIGVFQGCRSLRSVSLFSATSLKDYIFAESNIVNFIEFGSATPPAVEGGVFYSPPGNLVVMVPPGAREAYVEWSDGTIANAQIVEGNITPRGTLLRSPGQPFALTASFSGAQEIGELRWQKIGADGAWHDTGVTGPTYAIAAARTLDSGQYALAFETGSLHRSAPIRVAVGDDPVLFPETSTLSAGLGAPLNLPVYAAGMPQPQLDLIWFSPSAPGLLWSPTMMALTGTPTAEGLYHFWVRAANEYSFYSGNPASRTYALDVSYQAVTGVTLNKNETTILAGAAETLYAAVQPEIASNRAVRWSSDNPAVATVDSGGSTRRSAGGVVRGVAPGTARIVATTDEGAFTAQCLVTVAAAPISVTGVALDRTSLELVPGDMERLRAVVSPADATNQNLSWSTGDTSVAEVDGDGFVLAVGPGTATVTVTTEDGGRTASCAVRVSEPFVPVQGVVLNKVRTTLLTGTAELLYATVLPENATNQSVVWSTGDSGVATILPGGPRTRLSFGGFLRGVDAGNTTVTVTTVEGNKSAECQVTVSAVPVPVSGITLDRAVLELYSGQKRRLLASIWPEDATNQNVRWSSSHPEIAAVEPDGFVEAITAGTALIEATTEDGGFSAACAVTVLSSDSPGEANPNPRLRARPLPNGTFSDGAFTISFLVETEDAANPTVPIERIADVAAAFRPQNAARQTGWTLSAVSGDAILTLTGALEDGTFDHTFVSSLRFLWQDGVSQTVILESNISLAELIRDVGYSSGSSGCNAAGFGLPMSAALLGLHLSAAGWTGKPGTRYFLRAKKNCR